MTLERLQRVMAARGASSRRDAEALILAGRVTVDGYAVDQLGTKVDAQSVDIRVDGKPLRPQRSRYILLNKPSGYITTTSDERDRRTVMDLVDAPQRVYPVGRLDRDTEGLLLLTNDGEVANRVMHPRYELDKEYHILTLVRPADRTLQRVRDGVTVDGRRIIPTEFRIMRSTREGLILRMVIHEGAFHIVRRVMDVVGIPVERLRRYRIGPLSIEALALGKSRDLTTGELGQLFAAVRLEQDPARRQPSLAESRREQVGPKPRRLSGDPLKKARRKPWDGPGYHPPAGEEPPPPRRRREAPAEPDRQRRGAPVSPGRRPPTPVYAKSADRGPRPASPGRGSSPRRFDRTSADTPRSSGGPRTGPTHSPARQGASWDQRQRPGPRQAAPLGREPDDARRRDAGPRPPFRPPVGAPRPGAPLGQEPDDARRRGVEPRPPFRPPVGAPRAGESGEHASNSPLPRSLRRRKGEPPAPGSGPPRRPARRSTTPHGPLDHTGRIRRDRERPSRRAIPLVQQEGRGPIHQGEEPDESRGSSPGHSDRRSGGGGKDDRRPGSGRPPRGDAV